MPPRLSSADELAELTKIKREATLDIAQMGLDVAGLFDPSPVSDGASAGLSLGRAGAAAYEGELLAGAGHALDAGLSAVSAIPYLGDLVAKPFKFIRTATRLGKHVDNLGRLAKKGSDDAIEALKALESKICGKPGFEAICKKIKELLSGVEDAKIGQPGHLPDNPNPGWRKGQIPCFPAGTPVLTVNGTRLIEKIDIGEEVAVLAFGEKSPATGYVIGRYVGHTSTLVHITFDAGALSLTRTHPVWVHNHCEWIEAQHVRFGDFVLTSHAGPSMVCDVTIEHLSESATTFNLTIAHVSTFFAGVQAQILVHNDDSRSNRAGYSNYVLRDGKGNIYYSGMYGPNQTQADVEARHSRNGNRYNPVAGDRIELEPGTRSYGEGRRLEHESAVKNGTVIGRDGENYRGNRQYPMSDKRFPDYYPPDAC